jgi:hypothetical protein
MKGAQVLDKALSSLFLMLRRQSGATMTTSLNGLFSAVGTTLVLLYWPTSRILDISDDGPGLGCEETTGQVEVLRLDKHTQHRHQGDFCH